MTHPATNDFPMVIEIILRPSQWPCITSGKRRDLTVEGNARVANLTINGHIISSGNTPTIIAGTAAGEGAITKVLGNDTGGTITITTGIGISTDKLIELTYNEQFNSNPKVILTPSNKPAASLQYYVDSTTDKFYIYLDQPPAEQAIYKFNYFVFE